MMAATNPSDAAWADTTKATAALQLLQLKDGSPSRVETRAAGNFWGNELLKDKDSAGRAQQWSILGLPGNPPSIPITPSLPTQSLPLGAPGGRGSARRKAAPKKAAKKSRSRGNKAERTGSSFRASTTTAFDVVPASLPAPLAAASDADFLSPAQVYIRQHCVVLFEATAQTEARGRQSAVQEGRVGVRCAFCGHLEWKQRKGQSAAFPSSISKLCSSVVMIQCRHFPVCTEMPASVRKDLNRLKKVGSAPKGDSKPSSRLHYWSDSAHDLGLVDTKGGIRFVSRAVKPAVEPTSAAMEVEPSVDVGQALGAAIAQCAKDIAEGSNASVATNGALEPRPSVVTPPDFVPIFDIGALLEGQQLVCAEDRELVPAYLLLAMAQLEPCLLTHKDRVGSYKDHAVGSKGLCCRHCKGSQPGPGFGRFFPNSCRSLAQTTTTRTIVKHITSKCQHVPQNVRDTVKALLVEANENDQPTYAPKSAAEEGRPKYGDRSAFFQKIWNRIHSSNAGLSPALATNGPVASMPTFGGAMIRPTPIRRVAPTVSFDASFRAGGDHEMHDVALFDDKNRRVDVSVSGIATARKRSVSFADTFVDDVSDVSKKARV